jgi:hypothetical protein
VRSVNYGELRIPAKHAGAQKLLDLAAATALRARL